jgi:hypothetical protein
MRTLLHQSHAGAASGGSPRKPEATATTRPNRQSLLPMPAAKCENRNRERERQNVKVTLNIAGAILMLFGAIWFRQGVNVLPGSFMTGQIRWAV